MVTRQRKNDHVNVVNVLSVWIAGMCEACETEYSVDSDVVRLHALISLL